MNNILYISNTFDKSSSLFFTEMVCGIEARFFEGDGERGKNIKYSICDYQDNSFKYVPQSVI